MAAPYPDQQAYNPPPQPYQLFPEGGYQPAPTQFPSQQTQAFPAQGQPPGYAYGATTVVSAQPTPVTYNSLDSEADYSGMAMCALVFSIITLLCCGASLLCLACSVPALVLSINALGTTGSAQKSSASISIGLNVAVVACTVVFLVIFIPVLVVGTTRGCSAYYSSTYRTHCIPYSYSYYYYCTYYYTSGGYCPI